MIDPAWLTATVTTTGMIIGGVTAWLHNRGQADTQHVRIDARSQVVRVVASRGRLIELGTDTATIEVRCSSGGDPWR